MRAGHLCSSCANTKLGSISPPRRTWAGPDAPQSPSKTSRRLHASRLSDSGLHCMDRSDGAGLRAAPHARQWSTFVTAKRPQRSARLSAGECRVEHASQSCERVRLG